MLVSVKVGGQALRPFSFLKVGDIVAFPSAELLTVKEAERPNRRNPDQPYTTLAPYLGKETETYGVRLHFKAFLISVVSTRSDAMNNPVPENAPLQSPVATADVETSDGMVDVESIPDASELLGDDDGDDASDDIPF